MTISDLGVRVSHDDAGRKVLSHPEAETITREELTARARAMIPALRERANRTEEARQVLPETIDDFHRAGFFRICQPKRFGGFELGMDALQSVLVEVARGCASSAWVLGILTGHAWWASQFPEEGQVEVFGDDGVALLPTAVNGRGGRYRSVEGGYEVSGRWSYQSGVDAANWLGLGAFPAEDNPGPPRRMSFLIARDEGRVEDDWFVMGMRGTGSKTVVIDRTFVPERRAIDIQSVDEQDTPGSRLHANPLYAVPFRAFIAIELTGAAVGCAQAAVDVLDDLARNKPVRALGLAGDSGSTQMTLPAIRRRLAEVKSLADTAKTLLLSESERVMAMVTDYRPRGRRLNNEEISEVLLLQSNCIDLSVRAVSTAFPVAGTTASVLGHPLERALRDVYTISTHAIYRFDGAAENWGLAHFGLDNPLVVEERRNGS